MTKFIPLLSSCQIHFNGDFAFCSVRSINCRQKNHPFVDLGDQKRDKFKASGEQHKILIMHRPTTVSPLARHLPFANTPAVRLPPGVALWREARVLCHAAKNPRRLSDCLHTDGQDGPMTWITKLQY